MREDIGFALYLFAQAFLTMFIMLGIVYTLICYTLP